MDDHLTFASVHDLAALIETKELSPVELTGHFLDRIERYNPALNAYIAVTAERALAVASAAESAIVGGQYLGPLHGVPIALKDLIDTAGIPTVGGSTLLKDRLPTKDATIARQLFQAGAVLLGKTHLVEFAYGGTGINHHYGTPLNPWDLDTPRLPGGSSSGSAVAVAAGLAPAAMGSDTGGSVRIPSSFCGLAGLKTTFGRLSNAGLIALDSSLDSAGPMCRTVADAALIYQTLATPDPADPDTWNQPCDNVLDDLDGDISGLRLSLPRQYFWDDVDPEVEAAVRASAQIFASLGAHIDELHLPELDEMAELRTRGSLTAVEAYLSRRDELENQLDQFDPIVSARMLDGKTMTAADYFDAKRGFAQLRPRLYKALGSVDALLTPTTPFAALPVAEVDREADYHRLNGMCLRNTMAVNLMGLCAVSLPCGFTRDDLPIGLQIIGHPHAEGLILRLAQAYEQATEWHKKYVDLTALA